MKMPRKNLSTVDRTLRGLVGIICCYFGVFGGDLIGEPIVEGILLVFGLLNIISLLTGWCMVYQAANIDTSK
ncbi:DUF2892 domain-containing protein [Neptunomonas sp.]|uniref:YgaP family membrane protein n=1 Tax=Neptunomonas sp. TaxID=1971898 RepID=UPI0025EE768B|nr:DUF2892 domain-containing protein [Neptunomonas sp.]